MIKKTAIILLCGVTSTLSAEKLEFMKNGPALAANMTQQQRIEFMRNGRQIAQQIGKKPIQENKHVEKEVPLLDQEPIPQDFPLYEDDASDEDELLNYAIKLSLEDNQPRGNIIINRNITIKQKLNKSVQNINIGKKNGNY